MHRPSFSLLKFESQGCIMTKNQQANPSIDFQRILEASSLPVALCMIDGSSTFLNDAFSAYFRDGKKGNENIAKRFVSEDNWEQIIESIRKTGDWDSYAILNKDNGDEIVLKIKASLIELSKKNEIIALYFTETNEARRRVFRQGQLLKAASESSTALINTENLQESLYQVAESLGKAVQADRCYIFESTFLPDSDQIYASLVTQWSRYPELDKAENVSMISYTIFQGFYEALLEDEPYSRTREQLEGHSRKYLEKRQIYSFICLPIYKDEALWGFMGFDDCQSPRQWDEQEIASLRLLTNGLSSVISNVQLRSDLYLNNVQLESAIRASKDSLWDYDVRKERIYYSPQFMELLGYTANELEGSLGDLETFVHPKDVYKIYKRLQYVVSAGQEIRGFEIRLIHKSGSLVWIRITARPTTDLNGHTLRISGSNTDITLEKLYETRIAESQERYIELVDNLRETVFQLNKSGKIIFLNEAWNLISGASLSDSMGKPFRSYIIQEDQGKFEAVLKHLLTHKNDYRSCLVRITGQGDEVKWAEIFARSFFKKGNEPYILGTIIDVSQRQFTEQRLIESETRYRLISENISDLVTLQDELGKFVYVSPSVRTILGLNEDQILGNTPRQIWKEEQILNTAWERDLFDAGTENRKSYAFSKANGTPIWLETVRSIVYTDNDERFIIQSTTRDISAFKEAELSLKTALDKQRELNELKSNFISMASHEFRTPLTTIRSSIQLLEEYGKSAPEEQKLKMSKHYSRIKEQIERVTRLMNDVLTLGKFDAGKTPFNAKPHDLFKFCEEIISDHFSNTSDGRKIKLSQRGPARTMLFDASLLSHVLLNLLSNSLKYSNGRPDPELDIVFEEEKVSLIVRDFGIGIPEEDIRLVFQSFFRSKNAIDLPGTGLGLVITKEFVELHKGNIYIQSEINKQTEVIVELPIN